MVEALWVHEARDNLAYAARVRDLLGGASRGGVVDRRRMAGARFPRVSVMAGTRTFAVLPLLTSCSRRDDTRGYRKALDDTGRDVDARSVAGRSNLGIRSPTGAGGSTPFSNAF